MRIFLGRLPCYYGVCSVGICEDCVGEGNFDSVHRLLLCFVSCCLCLVDM